MDQRRGSCVDRGLGRLGPAEACVRGLGLGSMTLRPAEAWVEGLGLGPVTLG